MQNSKRQKLRFQFSLRFLICAMLLIGGAIGAYLGIAEPIKREWKIAGPIIARGGKVETVESSIPGFLTSLFPEGKTSHVEAVFANKNRIGIEEVKSLRHLPKLKRLYLERSGVTDEHLVEIAKLKSLERLSLWGNDKISDAGVESLKKLENLQVIDISRNRLLSWRSVLNLRRSGLEIRHKRNGKGVGLATGELEEFLLTEIRPSLLNLDGLDEAELHRVLSHFSLNSVALNVKSDAISNRVIDLIVNSEDLRSVKIYFSDSFNPSAFDYAIEKCSRRLEQFYTGKIPFDGGMVIPIKHGVTLVYPLGPGEYNNQILRFFGNSDDFDLSALPMLDHLEMVGLNANEQFPLDKWLNVLNVSPNVDNLWIRSTIAESQNMEIVCQSANLRKIQLTFPDEFALPKDWFANLKCKSNLEELRIRGTSAGVQELAPICDYPNLVHANLFCPRLPVSITHAWTEQDSIANLRVEASKLKALK